MRNRGGFVIWVVLSSVIGRFGWDDLGRRMFGRGVRLSKRSVFCVLLLVVGVRVLG